MEQCAPAARRRLQAQQQGGQPDAGAVATADPVPVARRPRAHHPKAAKYVLARRRSRITIVSYCLFLSLGGYFYGTVK